MAASESKKKGGESELGLVKGTRDLAGEEFLALQAFFERAAEIALYYGFQPLETPILEKADLFIRGSGEATDVVTKEMYTLKTRGGDHLALRPEMTPAVMRAYLIGGFQSLPQPVQFYSFGPLFRHDRPQRGRFRQFYQFNLDVLGTPKSVTDAMVIKLLLLILEDSGLKNLRVEINSIGDKECRANFRRELANYYKKNLRQVCPDCRERLKLNPLRVLDCQDPRCQEVKVGAPTAISYLCAPCKTHFREVLEHLDMLGIAYEINNSLVRGLDYYSRTVFEISGAGVTNEEGRPLAIAGGGRYDYLARTLGHKKDLPAVGGAIGVERMMLSPDFIRHQPRIVKKPKVFFIQLSFDAKLKSLEVIEVLRRAKIPMAQSLSKDSLATQLSIAEKLQVPYTLILGQKEALEGTVIVRNMQNRSQDIVPMAKLADYVRGLK
jgi:histidyl-tRNA synthetase